MGSRLKQEEEGAGSGSCDGEVEDSFQSFVPNGEVLKEAELIIPVRSLDQYRRQINLPKPHIISDFI